MGRHKRSFGFKSIYRSILKVVGAHSLPSLLAKEFIWNCRILDVGCGRSSPIRLIQKGSYKVGLDFYKPYIFNSKRVLIHDDYVLADARKLPFRPKSFDCAVAIEVLEHLSKHEGAEMINCMEEVAAKIILTTPNGFLPAYAGPNDNPLERHVSGWTVNELEEFGFRVFGFNGLRIFWGIKKGRAVIKKPLILFAALTISNYFVYHHPHLAFQLFCIKDAKADM